MEVYYNTVQRKTGYIVNGATVTVYLASTETLATLYKADGVTALANPFGSGYARSEGEVEFAAATAAYDIKIESGTEIDWLYRVVLSDPADIAASEAAAAASAAAALVSENNSAASEAATAADVITTNDNAVLTAADAAAADADRILADAAAAAALASEVAAGISETQALNYALSASSAAEGLTSLGVVSALIPALSYVDVAHFDNSKNSAWIYKCEDKSWHNETTYAGTQYVQVAYANDAAALAANPSILANDIYFKTGVGFVLYTTGTSIYRAGSQKFPMKGFATAEGGRPILWDTTGALPAMWAVGPTGLGVITSIAVKSHVIVIGSSTGVWEYNLPSSQWINYNATGSVTYSSSSFTALGTAGASVASGAIVNATVNDVAITALRDAPIDANTGLAIPTIAVATDGGVSVRKDDGNVWDITNTNGTYTPSQHVTFDSSNNLIIHQGPNTTNEFAYLFTSMPTADNVITYTTKTGSTLNADVLFQANASYADIIKLGIGKPKLATNLLGTSNGLTKYIANPATPAASLYAHITNAYNTGYMVGDIRRCFLANSKTADRSVKAGTLTEVGTVTETVNAGGRNVYSGFSAANYLQEASHADWNALGTGDFSIIMSGVKWGTALSRCLFSMGDGATAGSVFLLFTIGGQFQLYVHNGAGLTGVCAGGAFTDTAEHTLEIKRSTVAGVTGTIQTLVDGVVAASGVSTLTISNATGYLRIGGRQDASQPWTGGQVSTFRISATAPTAEQSAKIAFDENKLNGGELCLLSNSASVSALSYDESTDVYSVGNGTNVDQFKGLKRLSSAAHGVTTLTALASGGGAKVVVGTGGSYARPYQDLNSELKAVQLELAEANQGIVTKLIASDASSVLTFPQGFKPKRVMSAAGTYISLSTNAPVYDGFIWKITSGLAAATDYDVEMVRV